MKHIIQSLTIVLTCCVTTLVQAEIAVIVNPNAGISSLSEDEIAKVYLGKSTAVTGIGQVVTIAQDDKSPVKVKFNEVICKKNPSQYRAYWTQLVFTGKGTPPVDAGNDKAVKDLIAANPSMIGYIDASAVDASVKVVYKF